MFARAGVKPMQAVPTGGPARRCPCRHRRAGGLLRLRSSPHPRWARGGRRVAPADPGRRSGLGRPRCPRRSGRARRTRWLRRWLRRTGGIGESRYKKKKGKLKRYFELVLHDLSVFRGQDRRTAKHSRHIISELATFDPDFRLLPDRVQQAMGHRAGKARVEGQCARLEPQCAQSKRTSAISASIHRPVAR